MNRYCGSLKINQYSDLGVDVNKGFKAGVIQFDILNGDIENNMSAVMGYLRELAGHGADLAVLPELFSCGFDNENIQGHACRTNDTLEQLSEFGRANAMAIVGTFPQAEAGQVFNTHYFIDRDGKIKGTYQKVHLFRPTLEHKFYTAGSSAPVLDTTLGPVGLMICYDLRFPELARRLFLDGARILIVSAQWPSPRKKHWQILARARAVENQAYCICANRTGNDDDLDYPGLSAIIDPMGQVLAEAGADPGVLLADIDMDQVGLARNLIPICTDRRKDVYG